MIRMMMSRQRFVVRGRYCETGDVKVVAGFGNWDVRDPRVSTSQGLGNSQMQLLVIDEC